MPDVLLNLLTPAAAAKYLRCSPSLVYKLLDERRLPHYRVGGKGKRGKILISPSDLERFLEEQKIEAR